MLPGGAKVNELIPNDDDGTSKLGVIGSVKYERESASVPSSPIKPLLSEFK